MIMAEDMYPKPSVSRIVHYKDTQDRCLPAMITEVEENTQVALTVMPPMDNFFFVRTVNGDIQGTWHWPERV